MPQSARYSFLDYLKGPAEHAWELNMVVALDFTGSNGNPALPGTLHYCLPNQPGSYQMNPYEQTVLGLAPVLEQ